MRELAARSAIAERVGVQPAAHEAPGLHLRESALSVLGLRVRRTENVREVGARIGMDLPTSVNIAVKLGDGWIVCTEPGAWRMLSSPEAHRKSVAALADVPTTSALVTDLSSALAAIEICGNGARQAIASACPLDLHARTCKVGSAANSRLVEFPVLIVKISEEPGFLIVCERFHALTVWDWLANAASLS